MLPVALEKSVVQRCSERSRACAPWVDFAQQITGIRDFVHARRGLLVRGECLAVTFTGSPKHDGPETDSEAHYARSYCP